MNKFISIIVMLLLLMISCNKNEITYDTNILNISFRKDPLTLDPRKSGDINTSTLLSLIYKGLTHQKEDGTIALDIAKSYDLSDDNRTYTFHLKQCYWSDGTPITACDFERSWKNILSPSFPSLCPQLIYCIKNAKAAAMGKAPLDDVGIHAIDENTLVVELEQPTPYFLSITSFCMFYPVASHIAEKSDKWDSASLASHLVVSGPFKIASWLPNNKIIVRKNEKYWDTDKVQLDAIHINIIDNEHTAMQMFEKKQLDWVGTPTSPLPIDTIPTLSHKKEFSTKPIGGTQFCAFNVTRFPFNNKNFRKALSCCIDRQSITDNITQSNEVIATRCIPPVLMKKNRNIIDNNNPELAKYYLALALKELNCSISDITITMTYEATQLQKKLAVALQEQWMRSLNINVVLEGLESKSFFSKNHNHNCQMSLCYLFVQYNDPMNFFERFTYKSHPKNYSEWEDSKYIGLIDQSTITTDPVIRTKVLEQAENYFMDEQPIAPIFHYNYTMMTHDYVEGVGIGPIGEIYFEDVIINKTKSYK
jgi:oligopeptide transport system substrate-binding protein